MRLSTGNQTAAWRPRVLKPWGRRGAEAEPGEGLDTWTVSEAGVSGLLISHWWAGLPKGQCRSGKDPEDSTNSHWAFQAAGTSLAHFPLQQIEALAQERAKAGPMQAAARSPMQSQAELGLACDSSQIQHR